MTLTALRSIRITLLGEDELVIRGLASVLHDVSSIELVSVREWRERPHLVDLVLVDTSRLRSVEMLQAVVSFVPAGRLVLFCWELTPHVSSFGLRMGARGCLSKTLPSDVLVGALRRIARGERVVEGLVDPPRAVVDAALTHRETEMLALIASGASNLQIAELLRVSPNTVKSYVRSAYRKIGVGSRSRAVLWAVDNDLAWCDGPGRDRVYRPAPDRGAEGRAQPG
jgi:DNA-binding NarL/FixJ family response regulator